MISPNDVEDIGIYNNFIQIYIYTNIYTNLMVSETFAIYWYNIK